MEGGGRGRYSDVGVSVFVFRETGLGSTTGEISE